MLLLALILPLAAPVAQAASLVFLGMDINTAAAHSGSAFVAAAGPTDPRPAAPAIAVLGSTVFFAATDAIHGSELWQSDGTRDGTLLVSDINLGPGGSNPRDLTSFKGALYFAANDAIHGVELWKSDGTPGGTTLVADIGPAAADANIGNLTVVDSNLFFTANDGTHGNELWVFNGVSAKLVKDINTGADGSSPTWLTNFKGHLLFAAHDGTHGFQLWKSDGASANTSMLQVSIPGGNAYPYWLTPASATRLISADAGARGAVWWQIHETTTTPVKNINPSDGSNPLWLTAAGNSLFFCADSGTRGRELWKNDGPIGGGAAMIHDILPGAGGLPRPPLA